MSKTEELDINGVAALLGVSDRQVRTYMQAGLPWRRAGRKNVYDRAEVLAWHERYLTSMALGDLPGDEGDEETDEDESERPGAAAAKEKDDIRKVNLRRAMADADLKELALSEKRSQVISIADAVPRLDRLFGNLRTQLLSMAPKLATLLAGIKEPSQIESLIKEEMENLCRELSTGGIVGSIPEPEPETATLGDLTASADGGLSDRQLRRMARNVERAYAAE